MSELIFPDGASGVSNPIGSEKIMAAKAGDGKIVYILASDLIKGLATVNSLTAYQSKLASGVNVKMVNGQSILGPGEITFKTINGEGIGGSGDIKITGKEEPKLEYVTDNNGRITI
ncbi:hypothetical protein DBR43_19885 [Pedobacter sp. KBW06]|uniref:hypothetical protein n=1 Tax=Pedobacter sp. KBW06 TaxID=2153359 RepID=UPI000F59EFDC|nr:hypothetical protein [Pedobacter sp. KBW06]RQO70284.1 hypothetical protein DBR43_19885 [Pedobacter sp. KBW06]